MYFSVVVLFRGEVWDRVQGDATVMLEIGGALRVSVTDISAGILSSTPGTATKVNETSASLIIVSVAVG